jgi:hypothetical protein
MIYLSVGKINKPPLMFYYLQPLWFLQSFLVTYTTMKSEMTVYNLHVKDYTLITLERDFQTWEICGGNILKYRP